MRTLWDKVRDKIWLKMNWYSCNLTKGLQTVDERADIHFRPMQQDDLDKLIQNFPEELNERKYHILKDRLSEKGKEVFVAEMLRDDSPAGYFCVSITDTYVGGIKETLSVPAGTVYLFDDYVFEQYRGRQIHSHSIRFRMGRYLQLGCTKALVCIYASNDTSIKSYQKNGFQYIGNEIRIQPLGYMIRNARKK